ncbi:MAG: SDR family oxidoreductase [Spirochaetales bacterium]|jgi:uncharacterized protein|nr:SDR family oxidoreductase [Spirochaetales bacterium]
MNKTAVITGATSGIGAAFARHFAREGCNLLITGRRADIINALAQELEQEFDISVQVLIAEFSLEADLNRVVEKVDSLLSVDVLINNAGFGKAGAFAKDNELHWSMLNVHIIATLRLVEAVVPGMMERNRGIIINVSSLAAFFPMIGSTTYAATKGYLNSFSESLQMELWDYNIKVQALCPGMTTTDFHRKMGEAGKEIQDKYFLKWMKPEAVVKYSARKLSGNRVICIPGIVNKIMARLIPRLPRLLYYRIAKKARK